MMPASTEELACVYSALILQDGNSNVTADKLATLLKAANTNIEPFWPGLFSKAIESINLSDLISNVGAGAGTPAAGAPAEAAAASGPEAKREEKEEEAEDSGDDMGFGLFD